MLKAKVTNKGQITIPKAVRDKLQLTRGSKVVLEQEPNGGILIRGLSDVRLLSE